MNKFLLLLVIALLTLTSCTVQYGYLKFDGKSDEIITSPAIKAFMQKNPSPSIVIKAPDSEEKTTEKGDNSYIYSTIEKELMKAGFNIKDRGLFNEIVGKSGEIKNYNQIKKLTKTDLILELVRISTEIKYLTNVYYEKDGEKDVVKDHTFKKYGAAIEFKLIIIGENKYAGSYTFHYTPCSEAKEHCRCTVAYKNIPNKIYPDLSFCRSEHSYHTGEFEYVSQDALEAFVRDGVQKMITEIKQ